MYFQFHVTPISLHAYRESLTVPFISCLNGMLWTLHHLFNGFKDVMQNIKLWKFWCTLDGSINRFNWTWDPLVWTFYLVWKYELCLMYAWRHCDAHGCCCCCLFSFAHIRICNLRCMLMSCMIYEYEYLRWNISSENHTTPAWLKKHRKGALCRKTET